MLRHPVTNVLTLTTLSTAATVGVRTKLSVTQDLVTVERVGKPAPVVGIS